MQNFLRKVKSIARKDPKSIVFPESDDIRILKAVAKIVQEKFAKPILIGDKRKIKSDCKKNKLKIDWEKVTIIDQTDKNLIKKYSEALFLLRKDKGVTEKEARNLIKDPNYFGTMMIQLGDADGMITGATHPTANSIRPVLQIIKTREKFHKVSGIFFMVLHNKPLLFADAAITIEPNSHDLRDIAIDTAETAKIFGLKPKIALLSFSTKGSAKDPEVDKVTEAVALIKDRRPDLIVDGELQVDAALVPEVAKRKCPDSPLHGTANILIFPDLQAANIAYKLVERLAKAKAIGPLLQGLKKPVNKLSRGCSWQDVVNVAAFTVCECQHAIK
ncbi:MAG: phosphate acetyltransferase [Candidatus Peregrinibacteria bacterium]|nr:phosphate acetyltransferase [Candidatus Peregrinibacteria bacterium]